MPRRFEDTPPPEVDFIRLRALEHHKTVGILDRLVAKGQYAYSSMAECAA